VANKRTTSAHAAPVTSQRFAEPFCTPSAIELLIMTDDKRELDGAYIATDTVTIRHLSTTIRPTFVFCSLQARYPESAARRGPASMAPLQLTVNGKLHEVEAVPETPLLWILRDTLRLTGTKYGCGLGLCGACTVHIDDQAVRSCQTPVASVGNRKITTIEGLGQNGIHRVQAAWIAEQVPQCGYCQSGQIMQAVALLRNNPHPSVDEINVGMAGNICRCATYQRIRRAIQRAAENKG
jgi:isoquinoline 1-oxidoreductase alpha subunit